MINKLTYDQLLGILDIIDHDKNNVHDYNEYYYNFSKAIDTVLIDNINSYGGRNMWQTADVEQLKSQMTFEKFQTWLDFFHSREHDIPHGLTLNEDFSANLNEYHPDIHNWPEVSAEDYEKIFNDLFYSAASLKQRSVGDCYLVVLLLNFREHKDFQNIVKDAFKIFRDPQTQELAYEVKIPMFAPDHEANFITVYQEDFSPVENPNYQRESSSPNNAIDTRADLRGLQGPTGFRILEAAFAKAKTWDESQQRAQMLYDPWNVGTQMFAGNEFSEITSLMNGQNWLDIEWNNMVSASEFLFGKDFIQGLTFPCSDNIIKTLLKTFDPKQQMVMFASHSSLSSDSYYTVDGITFNAQHAYALQRVDTQNRIFYLINPHFPDQPMAIPFETCVKSFSHMQIVRIID